MFAPRLLRVMDLIHLGRKNREIAEEMQITESTVKKYVQQAMDKTGTRTRAGLAVWFYKEYREKRWE